MAGAKVDPQILALLNFPVWLPPPVRLLLDDLVELLVKFILLQYIKFHILHNYLGPAEENVRRLQQIWVKKTMISSIAEVLE